jgi:hypothetical protein
MFFNCVRNKQVARSYSGCFTLGERVLGTHIGQDAGGQIKEEEIGM